MASKRTRFSKRTRRIGTFAFVLLFFVFGACFLAQRLVAQLYYQKGLNHLREGYYLSAVREFEKAVDLQPGYSAAWRELGRARGSLADLYPVGEAFPLAQEARRAYLRAVALAPLDGESVFGLARAEARLESLYPRAHSGSAPNPYNPLAYFERAIGLRPNGISYRYTLARYLYQKGEDEALGSVVKGLARIYPTLYNRLRNEAFWSPALAREFKRGVVEAMGKGNDSRDVHLVLARILEDEKDWAGALAHFQKAMALETGPHRHGQREDFKHLGRLFLKAGKPEKAADAFLDALYRSDAPARDLEGFFREFERAGYSGELPGFYGKVKAQFSVSGRMDIVLARVLIRSGMLEEARTLLIEKNRKEPSAPAWYWLARIAEKEKDTKAMADALVKAVSLDPRNSGYHLLLSRVFARTVSLLRAEREAGQAIRHAERPWARLFLHRANIRLRRGDYSGAAADLEKAISLEPENKGLQEKLKAVRKRVTR